MSARYSRRQLLRGGVTAGAVGLAGCRGRGPFTSEERLGFPGRSAGEEGSPVDVRGAIYLPTRAFNIYQMWWRYDPAVVERDLGYAAEINLNAVRVWTSYEWWAFEPERHAESLEHFLATAAENGLAVLVDLFEGIGKDPDRHDRENDDPATAVPVTSPADDIMANERLWGWTREYVEWFADRHRNDDRLLAISVMNEPGWSEVARPFAAAMFETLAENRGSVPITVGSTSLTNSRDYHGWGADVLQFHYNFVREPKRFRRLLWEAAHLSETLSEPVWLTEWQRFRTTGGANDGHFHPDYASMVPPIREAGIGNFFWSLMVKPAYVRHQRELGTFSGVFHEDGAVWSLEDARAIKSMSGDPHFEAEERATLPDWMRAAFDEE